ncbi:MAG: HdeD family acid-resistance protein [Bacteroidota bacterium]
MDNRYKMFFSNPRVILIQGILILLFGILALSNPEMAIKLLIRFFGLIITITGISLIVLNRTNPEENIATTFWFYFGVINVVIGLVFIINPQFIVSFFFILVGLIALISGVLNMWRQIQYKEGYKNPAFLKNGIAILFGLLILVYPFEGAEAATIVTGIFAVIYGLSALVAAYRLK